MFIIGTLDTRSQEQKIRDIMTDYNGDTSTYLKSVCSKTHLVPTGYKHNARQFKTREAAQKMLDKLQTFNGKTAKECGYIVIEY